MRQAAASDLPLHGWPHITTSAIENVETSGASVGDGVGVVPVGDEVGVLVALQIEVVAVLVALQIEVGGVADRGGAGRRRSLSRCRSRRGGPAADGGRGRRPAAGGRRGPRPRPARRLLLGTGRRGRRPAARSPELHGHDVEFSGVHRRAARGPTRQLLREGGREGGRDVGAETGSG